MGDRNLERRDYESREVSEGALGYVRRNAFTFAVGRRAHLLHRAEGAHPCAFGILATRSVIA